MICGLAEQYTELAPISRARNPVRMASSAVAIPCGVDPERKLVGAAATRRESRACASGVSKGSSSNPLPPPPLLPLLRETSHGGE